MSNLNIDQKNIYQLLSEKNADFLIPDYQRPYAWTEEQCQTLWDDIFSFSFPENNYEKFDPDNDEYFLGTIVTYKNNKKSEVIDGQQRLTTIMLMLRAFYDKFANMNDDKSKSIREKIEKCIWKTDEFGKADKTILKIDSEVATDLDKVDFLDLLRTGVLPTKTKSQYTKNFQFFLKQIDIFLNQVPSYFPYLPARILDNCIFLPIEANSQDTALRIFSTLNDRGLPLSDADIFKAQFYKHFSALGTKDDFISNWRELESVSNRVFKSNSGSPLDELFSRYMYFLRAKEGNKSSTTEGLRKFYEKNEYQYLKDDETITNLMSLATFWESVMEQDKDKFSEDVLKKLYVLNYSPNGMWQNILSVYFLTNKVTNDKLDNNKLDLFLSRIIAFTFTYAITNPGVNALRTPIYDEMINIINNKPVTFSKYKFNKDQARRSFDNYIFGNQRKVTRSIMAWRAFSFKEQKLLTLSADFHLEHIYSRKRQDMEKGLKNKTNLENLGNKVLLEKNINIKASDYRFDDKRKIYNGELRRGKNKDKSKIFELEIISSYKSFNEERIIDRGKEILNEFFKYLESEELLA